MHTNRAEKAIMKQDALGRVTHTREQREALLNEFERSGMMAEDDFSRSQILVTHTVDSVAVPA